MRQPHHGMLARAASLVAVPAIAALAVPAALVAALVAGGCRERAEPAGQGQGQGQGAQKGESPATQSGTNPETPPGSTATGAAEQPKAAEAVPAGASAEAKPVIDEATGLIKAPGYEVVLATCTACHSAKLVVQNRGTRGDWEELLRWMQAKHNLWQMTPEVRDTILEYLATNYGVDEAQRSHRRKPLPSYLMPPLPGELAQATQATP